MQSKGHVGSEIRRELRKSGQEGAYRPVVRVQVREVLYKAGYKRRSLPFEGLASEKQGGEVLYFQDSQDFALQVVGHVLPVCGTALKPPIDPTRVEGEGYKESADAQLAQVRLSPLT